MNRTIITHRSCPDGYGSFYVAQSTFFGPDADHFEATYDGVLPPWDLIDGRAVLIADFCFETDVLNEMAQRSASLIVLDHHQTAEQFLEDSTLERYPSVEDLFHTWFNAQGHHSNAVYVHDSNYSGVGLVGRAAVTCGFTPPEFIWYLEDRDLWRFQLTDTPDVFAAVTSRPYTLEAWDEIAATPIEDLVVEGKAINRYRNQLIDQVAASFFLLRLGDYLIPCVSSPYAIGSDVAGRLAEESAIGIGAYCILHEHEVQIGLRSRNDGPDVAELAERFGGGGHRAASGLRLHWDEFADAQGCYEADDTLR